MTVHFIEPEFPFSLLTDCELTSLFTECSMLPLSAYEDKIYKYLDAVDNHALNDSDTELYSNLISISDNYSYYHLGDYLNFKCNYPVSFIICALNIRSIPNNLDVFLSDILHPACCMPDFICLTETKLSEDIEEFL